MRNTAHWTLDGQTYAQQKVTVLPGLSLVSVIAQRVQA
jgi:hypothetical protein